MSKALFGTIQPKQKILLLLLKEVLGHVESSTREEHGLRRQGSWAGHILEAKQEDCEEWNERNGKSELTWIYLKINVLTRSRKSFFLQNILF